MTRWSDFDRYVRGEHLQGRRVMLTITAVRVEEVHANGIAEQKPVLYFKETKKGLIVTPTNMRTLSALFGDDMANCIGKRVALEAAPMRVAGRDTLPVRIFAPDAPPANAPAGPDPAER